MCIVDINFLTITGERGANFNLLTISFIKLIKQSKKCIECNKIDNTIYYPVSNEVFNGSILTPSLASFIMYHKYELGIPFHHLAQHLTLSLGFEITKQNLANYMPIIIKT